MAGRPKSRARQQAAAMAEGRATAAHVDTRPTKKPLDRERGYQEIRRRSGPQVGLPGVTDVAPRDVDDEQVLGDLVGQMAFDPLDDETNAAFEDLRRLAFAHARQVMAMELDPESKHFPKVLQTKTVITQAILTATTRIRPGDLREKDEDGVGALLEQVRAQETGSAAQAANSGADAGEEPASDGLSVEDRARRDLLS